MKTEIMTPKALNLRLYKIFRKMGVPRYDMSLQANLHTDLYFDDFDMNIFCFFLESKFNIQVNDAEVNKLNTIEQTLHYIEHKLYLS